MKSWTSMLCLLVGLAACGGGNNSTGPKDETANWQDHFNMEMSFGFKYPQTWRVDDGLRTNTCCLDIFSSADPYEGDFLNKDVMKAQFQYHINALVSNKQQYIDSLIKSTNDDPMQTSVDRSSVVSLSRKGLDILKFSGGPSGTGYVIPIKENFSEVIYVIVWNNDSTFEKVLSTFYVIRTRII